MGLKFQARKGTRIKYGAFWVQADARAPDGEWYWWLHKEKRWVPHSETAGRECTNTFHSCRSVRAFRRHLRKWSKYLPNGVKFKMTLFIGHDITGTIRNEKRSQDTTTSFDVAVEMLGEFFRVDTENMKRLEKMNEKEECYYE